MAVNKLDKSGARFMILDGNSLLYRAFFALPPLSAPSGEYTNAVFGFANMLLKILQDYEPDFLVIAFDKGKHTFRTDMYDGYKATREKTPPELVGQFATVREFADAMGIKYIEIDDYEADDIIGTLSTKAASMGMDTIAVTGDRDALQLIGKNLRILFTKKGIRNTELYDERVFAEEYGGLEPKQLIDLKGLMGDTSDNIPGVKGVGQKTAVKLLQEYRTVDGVLANIDAMKGALKQKLTEGKDAAKLSKKLATIELNVPNLEFVSEDYKLTPDRAKVKAFCDRYDLKQIWKAFDRYFVEDDEDDLFAPKQTTESYAAEFLPIDSKAALADFLQGGFCGAAAVLSGKAPFLALDGLALANGDKTAFVTDKELMTNFLEYVDTVFVLGAKNLYHAGLREQDKFFDVKLAAYLLRPESSDYTLNTLLPDEVPLSFETPRDEACFTAHMLLDLGRGYMDKLRDNNLMTLYEDLEKPLVAVLANMEEQGIYVDREHLRQKSQAAGERIAEFATSIKEMAGEDFNISSSKQLARILFEKLNLPPKKKTKSGYSTDAEVLNALRGEHPIVDLILRHRFWSKMKSTYLDGIGELIDERTGRVHTTFHQTVTATGRLSSSDPNLQNIPVRTEEGREIRALFEPGEGYDAILSADYSQIELRVLAHMANDETFIEAFRQNLDIHAHTAAKVFGVPLEDVTPELRRRAKAVNFGLVYGISDFGLSRDLGISRKEAGEFIARYFDKYSAVKKFMDDTIAEARQTGMVKTLFGRCRELPTLKSANYNQRTMAERVALNTPIQGTAADIIKIAMRRAFDALNAAEMKSRILLQVHDELVLEVVEDEIDEVTALIKDAMENAAKLSVPLVVNISVGKNWAEAK